MKLQIIQLEPYDDVISVRDRLSFVNTERVLLVWPRAMKVLNRKLDLVLIQREAARRGARLALVTDDLDVLDHAAELNISVFATPKASYRATWKKPHNKVFIDRSDQPDQSPDPYELMLTQSRLRMLTPEQRRYRRIVRGITMVVLVTVLAIALYLLVPSAEVIVYPAQSQINTTVQLVADPSITVVNVDTGHIPATLLVLNVKTQASMPTTGSEDIPNTIASGTVVFTNLTTDPVPVPTGTVVSTFGIKPSRFQTMSDITVNGGIGQTAQVTIEALQDSAGPIGNVEANLITTVEGTLSQSVSVRNVDPTQGGTIRQQGIVTKDDTTTLLNLTREKLRQTALSEFSKNLNGTEFIAPDSIKIIEERPEWLTYSSFVGDPADSLTLDMQARVQALVIDEQLAKQATLAKLSSKILYGQEILPQSITFTRGAFINTDPNGLVTFVMTAAGNITITIDQEQVRERLAGTNLNDAANILEGTLLLDPRYKPQISIWPSFLHQLPLLPLRITVITQS